MATNPILDRVQPDLATPAPVSAPVSAPSVTPAPNPRLQAVEESIAASSERLTEITAATESRVAKTTSATGVITSAIQDMTASQQIINSTQNAADLQAQNATISAFEASGGTDTQVLLMKTLEEEGARVADLLDQKADIVDNETTGFDFLDAIINEFSAVSVDAQLEVARAEQVQTVTQIQNISAATESFARVNSLTKQTLNDASIQAEYENIAAQGRIKVAEADIKNLNSNAAAMDALANADARTVSNRLQLYRLENEEQSKELSKERQKLQREQITLARDKMLLELPQAKAQLEATQIRLAEAKDPKRKAALQLELDAKIKAAEDSLAVEAQMTTSVQQAQSIIGLPIEDKATIAVKLRSPVSRERYFKLQEVGMSEGASIGLNPFEAKATLDALDPEGTATSSVGSRLLEQVSQIQVEQYRKLEKKDLPKTEEELASDFNKTSSQVFAAWNLDIRTGDSSNPLHAPPMDTLVANKAVQADPFYQKILAAMGMKEVNPQSIMDAAINGVLSKTVSPEVAANGIDLLFTTAADYNNSMQGGFKRIGFPNQTQYNVKLARPATAFEKLTAADKSIPRTSLQSFVFEGKPSKDAGANFIDNTESTFIQVDLMDSTKIRNTLVQILSSTPVPKTKPASEAPSTSPAAADTSSEVQAPTSRTSFFETL